LRSITLFLWACILSPIVSAETLEVEYASFYGHVKKLDDPDTNALRFAFGFWHIDKQRLCHIESAKIVTQKQQIPLVIENNARFTVPLDKILKMARATVNIELTDQANQCDISVQLETLPVFLKTQYTNSDLMMLFKQYQSFFNDIGGLFSFLMPSVEGLSIKIDKTVEVTEGLKPLLNAQGSLQLSQQWIEEGNTLTLSQQPLRITAIIEK
jgi:hypothetical protein